MTFNVVENGQEVIGLRMNHRAEFGPKVERRTSIS